MISIKLGRLDLLVAVEVEFEAEVEVEIKDGVEVEIKDGVEVEELDSVNVGANLDGLGGSLIALVGTGLGSPILLKGSMFVKCFIGGGRYDFVEETVDNTEGVL